MGKQRAGTKIHRKHIIKHGQNAAKTAAERLAIIQNALFINAGFHKELQHQICICLHGATKHFEARFVDRPGGEPGNGERLEHPCSVPDCTCEAFHSNYEKSLENWRKEVQEEFEKLGLKDKVFTQAGPESKDNPLLEFKMIEAFETGKKPPEYAKIVQDWLEKNATEKKEPS